MLVLSNEYPPMPTRARSYWKGHLRLSLVSIPVEVYNAVESQSEISFRQIHKPSGRRISMQRVVEGIGKVENSDIVKGYEVEPDTYVLLEPAEIEAVKLDSKKTIDLVQFVDASEIDYRFFERPYFLTPADKLAGEGYIVIRDALRKSGKLGLAQFTVNGREWLVAVGPLEDGLVMEMLRYPDELRKTEDFFDEVPGDKPTKEMVDLALQLINQKTAPFKPEKFENRYQQALQALVDQKRKGKKIVSQAEAPRALGKNVVVDGVDYGHFTGEAQFDDGGNAVVIEVERANFRGPPMTLDIEQLVNERIALRRKHGAMVLEETTREVLSHRRRFELFQALAESIEVALGNDVRQEITDARAAGPEWDAA
jgi:DNA end-binding protein Ku